MAREIRRKAMGVGAVPERYTGSAFVQEDGADTIVITDLPFAPATGGVKAYVLRADDYTVAIDGEVDGDGAAVITLVADCYHVSGRIVVSVYITGSDASVQCVYSLVGSVYRSQSGTVLDSGTVVPSLDQLTTVYQECLEIVEELEPATVAETKSYLGIT